MIFATMDSRFAWSICLHAHREMHIAYYICVRGVISCRTPSTVFVNRLIMSTLCDSLPAEKPEGNYINLL